MAVCLRQGECPWFDYVHVLNNVKLCIWNRTFTINTPIAVLYNLGHTLDELLELQCFHLGYLHTYFHSS